jgi:hypothetical protein
MKKIAIALAFFVVCVLDATAGGRQTIVGYWREAVKAGQCEPKPDLSIRPMALIVNEYACDFRSVSRAGDDVTWTGKCGFGDQQEEVRTVVASLRGNQLSLAFNGMQQGVFKRCPR